MKVAITGHTKGIGKAIMDHFDSNGHVVYGFSRTNGYDINTKESIDAIVSEISDFDILINNAYFVNAQTNLLEAVINAWEGTDKIIVNVNSKATLMSEELLNSNLISPFMREYVADKRNQTQMIMRRIFKASPHIINILTGVVDTEMGSAFNCKKMLPVDLARFIYMLVEFKDTVAVQNIVLDVPGLDWKDIR